MSERKKQCVCGNRRFLISHGLFGFIACDPQLDLFQSITSHAALKWRDGETRSQKVRAGRYAEVQLFIQQMIWSWASDKMVTWFAPSTEKKSMNGNFCAKLRPIPTGITSSLAPWKIAIFASGLRFRI